jgi:hypothetical protein
MSEVNDLAAEKLETGNGIGLHGFCGGGLRRTL